jgi:activator of the mannose operon (transcriptional antiterminator)
VNVENLKNALIGHVRPMIHRLKEDILIVNPLLNDIQFSYNATFTQVKTILAGTSYHVSDDEVGFLTLYVVRALEEASVRKRVLLMCSTGIGTAQLLQTRVRRAFPDFEIVGTVSARDYEINLKHFEQVDLVISTVAIHFQPVSPVIQVSALFNEGDRRRVEELLYG